MTQTGTPTGLTGVRFCRDFTNSVDGQEWIGQFSLFVLYSRELTFAELKDSMLLARSKCGITWATGRVAA
jgi:hypothetical protein